MMAVKENDSLETEETEQPPERNAGVDVQLDDEDDDGDDEDPDPAPEQTQPQPGEPGRRKAQKRERGGWKALAEQLQREREEDRENYRQQLQTVQQQLQEVRAPKGETKNPEDIELERIRLEKKVISRDWQAIANTATPAQVEEFERRAEEIKEREAHAIYQKVQRKNAPDPQAQANQQEQMFLATRYPDIMSNPRAKSYQIGRYQAALATGAPHHLNTWDRIAEETRRQFQMATAAPATPAARAATRSRLSGVGSGGGGGQSRGRTVHLSDLEKKMADRAFPHITDDAKRYAHFVRTNGLDKEE